MVATLYPAARPRPWIRRSLIAAGILLLLFLMLRASISKPPAPKQERFSALVYFLDPSMPPGGHQKRIENIKNWLKPCDIAIVDPARECNLRELRNKAYKYVLFTGNHGLFQHGKPRLFNGISHYQLTRALARNPFSAQVLILDTCFSSSFIPAFCKAAVCNKETAIIAAHGLGRGYTHPSGIRTTLASYCAQVFSSLDQTPGLPYNSMSLYVHSPDPANSSHGKLYTRDYGPRHRIILEEARKQDPSEPTYQELQAMEAYLQRQGIAIARASSNEMRALLRKHLKNIPLSPPDR